MIRWNVSPELLDIGPVHIRWYGLLFAFAFIWGSWIFDRLNRTFGGATDENALLKYVVIGTILGARLGHCLFYDPVYYWNHPLEVLMVWKGGLASHGGAIGVLFAVRLYCRKHAKDRMLTVLDLLSVPTAFAGFFIRMGNLMNSEIIGKPTDLPWAFMFQRIDSVPRHPAQLYEALVYFGIANVLVALYSRKRQANSEGQIFGLFLILIFSARFLLEFLKEVQSPFEADLPFDMGQLLSVPLIAFGTFLVFVRSPPSVSEMGKSGQDQ